MTDRLYPPESRSEESKARQRKCHACYGSGRRHSMFDQCNCEPACTDEWGVCAWCNGTKLEPQRGEP